MNKAYVRRIVLAAWDCLLCSVTFAFSLIFTSAVWKDADAILLLQGWRYMAVIIFVHLLVFVLGGAYQILWRVSGVLEALRLLLLESVSCTLILTASTVFSWQLSRAGLVLTAALTILSILASRFVWQLLQNGRFLPRSQTDAPPVIVVGAGEGGAYVIGRLLTHANHQAKSIVLVDDDPQKQGARIHNVPVRGTLEDIPVLADRHGVKEIMIAIPSLYGPAYSNLISLCSKTKCHVRVLMTSSDFGKGYSGADQTGRTKIRFRDLDPTDFLSREEVVLDTDKISDYITGRTVLVTGGGGSIGSELCRQVMRFSPEALYIFDNNENNAYELLGEIRRLYQRDFLVQVIIGSIRDRERLNDVFRQTRPNVVFHAAAHKHVSLMEYSPGEAIKNNVIGTRNVLEAAAAHGVERFVLLSTDKAVNPTNVMGATKRVCEMQVQLYAARTKMKCMAVRFGNVLGSSGSVIPLFVNQIRTGGPVTITHPEISRYFMTIPEAAQLVMQAGGLADNGAIYVLDMGEPVKIMDLATKLIRFYGYTPDEDIQILYTGLRTGEKMYEELLTDTEKDQMRLTAHSKISVAPPIPFNEEVLLYQIAQLETAAWQDTGAIRGLLQGIVETYQPQEKVS